jgi:hypothetical protein
MVEEFLKSLKNKGIINIFQDFNNRGIIEVLTSEPINQIQKIYLEEMKNDCFVLLDMYKKFNKEKAIEVYSLEEIQEIVDKKRTSKVIFLKKEISIFHLFRFELPSFTMTYEEWFYMNNKYKPVIKSDGYLGVGVNHEN